jgi:WD40 repeat protein
VICDDSPFVMNFNRGAIRSVAFSHDGQYLASASDDLFITLVRPQSSLVVQSFIADSYRTPNRVKQFWTNP